MDPEFIAQAQWGLLGPLLKFLWLYLLLAIGFAGSLLLAHMVIPSLTRTGFLPAPFHGTVQRLRMLLYGTAMVALLGAAAMIANAVARAGIIAQIYERWWY
jgi:hypothetical protein